MLKFFNKLPNDIGMNKIILTLAVLALATIGGHAQDKRYAYDRNGNCIYSNYGGYETFYSYDGHGNLTYQYSTGEYPQPTWIKPIPAATPVPPAKNSSHDPRHTVVQDPIAVAQPAGQSPVTVIEGQLTPEQARRLANGE